jgi:hypothetical protein
MAQAWRSARRFSIAALVVAFTLMIAAALLGTPDVAAASAGSSGRYARPHVDVVVNGPLARSPRPAPGPPGSPDAAGAAAENVVANEVPALPAPAPQIPAPDRPARTHVSAALGAAEPEVAATTPHHPARVRSLDVERVGRSLIFTGGAAALLAAYGLILVGFRRRLW